MLRRDNCASTSQLVDFIERGRFRMFSLDDEEKTLRYVDEEEKTLFLSFPAILNLKGAYSHIQYSTSEGNEETVSLFFFFFVQEENNSFFLGGEFFSNSITSFVEIIQI